MQPQQRTDSGPAQVQVHATAQIEAFRRHIGSAVSAASEKNAVKALKALGQASNAFTGLAQFLRNRTAAKQPLDLRTINQPLMAARSNVEAGRWSEALPQIDQMLRAGLAMIRALADQIATDGTPAGSPGPPTNSVPSQPSSRRDRPFHLRRHRRR
jgi:hypothetical protein